MKLETCTCDPGADATGPGLAGTIAFGTWIDRTIGRMTTLARFSVGRVLLHLLALLGDRCVRFHAAGIAREISNIASAPVLRARVRARSIEQLVRYLSGPRKRCTPATTSDAGPLAAILDRGDVLLSEGHARLAVLVKRITRVISSRRPFSRYSTRRASGFEAWYH